MPRGDAACRWPGRTDSSELSVAAEPEPLRRDRADHRKWFCESDYTGRTIFLESLSPRPSATVGRSALFNAAS